MRWSWLVILLMISTLGHGAQVLHYDFEHTNVIGNGVIENRAAGLNGNGTGRLAIELADSQRSCQALLVEDNLATTSAVDTQVSPSTLGPQGTISFWYRAGASWYSNTPRTLFDASTVNGGVAANQNHFFLLTLRYGSLFFMVDDSNGRYVYEETPRLYVNDDQWLYITLQWDTSSPNLRIYVNGTDYSTGANVQSGFNGIISPYLNSLYLGDNRSSAKQSDSIQTTRSAAGLIDEVRIYNEIISTNQIANDYNSVTTCSINDKVWYEFNGEANGSNSAEDSLFPSQSGTPLGSTEFNVPRDQLSCQALDVTENNSANVLSGMDMGISPGSYGATGTLSFWYRSKEAWNNGKYNVLLDASDGNGYMLGWIDDAGRVSLLFQDNSGNRLTQIFNAQNFAANQWHHLAIRWDWVNRDFDLYIDGNAVSQSSVSGYPLSQNRPANLALSVTSSARLRLGDARYNYSFSGVQVYSANAHFDDVRFYPFTQTRNEIIADANVSNKCNALVQKFEFEQASWLGADAVKDTSGNDWHADYINNLVSPQFPNDQVSCRVMDVPANYDEATVAAITNNISMTEIGNQGTISFWYKANQDWNSGYTRTLFDASTYNSTDVLLNRFFYLAITASGGLEFGLEDQDDWDLRFMTAGLGFAANEWVHIAASWNLSQGTMQFIVNGQVVAANNLSNPQLGNRIGDLDSLYLGDSRSSYIVANTSHSHNSADGQLDAVRIYSHVQDTVQVNADMLEVNRCSGLAAFYQFEQLNWDTSTSIIDSSGNDFHAGPTGSVVPMFTSPQKSCKAMFVPDSRSARTNDYLSSPVEVSDFSGSGTISMWYKSPEAWQQAGRARTLMDTFARNSQDRFTLYINSDGSLTFEVSDTNYNVRKITTNQAYAVEAEAWVHIAVSWDVVNQQYNIFVDGIAAATNDNGVVLGSELAQVRSIKIGDNRNSFSPVINSANGYYDDVRIYYFAQDENQVQSDLRDTSPCSFVDHYELEFSSTAQTCAPLNVEVRACMDNACDVLFDQPAQLDLQASAGSWSASTLSFTGRGEADLSVTEAQTVLLGIANAAPDASLVCMRDGSPGQCESVFAEAQLQVSWGQTTPLVAVPNQSSQVSVGTPLLVSAPQGCETALAGKTLDIGARCLNPASCNANMLNIGGVTVANPSSWTATTIQFDANGVATIPADTVRYDDAGSIALAVKTSDNSAQGVSNDFVVVPQLQLVPQTPGLPIAGVDYPLAIQAIGALGQVTPNYQPGQLQFVTEKQLPVNGQGSHGEYRLSNSQTGQAASLTTSDAGSNIAQTVNPAVLNFVQGQAQDLQASYSEAGNISISISDADYLGAVVPASATLVVGRHIPAYFSVSDNSPELAHGHGSFSYTGQGLGFVEDPLLSFAAMNARGEAINNYIGSLMRLVTPGSVAADDILFSDNSGYAGTTTADEGTWRLNQSGVAEMLLEQPQVTYVKDASGHRPFDADIGIQWSAAMLTDADGVCYQLSYPGACQSYQINSITGTRSYYGQWILENAYGPETEDVAMLMQTRIIDDSGNWVRNQMDNLSFYTASDVTVIASEINPVPAKSGAGVVTQGQPASAADAIIFSAPGAGVTGRISVNMDVPAYMLIDINNDGVLDSNDNPAATINFGLFRGNDRIIHWRENGSE